MNRSGRREEVATLRRSRLGQRSRQLYEREGPWAVVRALRRVLPSRLRVATGRRRTSATEPTSGGRGSGPGSSDIEDDRRRGAPVRLGGEVRSTTGIVFVLSRMRIVGKGSGAPSSRASTAPSTRSRTAGGSRHGPFSPTRRLARRQAVAREEPADAPARRHREDPADRLGADRDRAGGRVRLLRRAGLQGAAGGGLRGRARQLEPGDDHDRPGVRRPHLRRAAAARARSPR